tara:strand:- start:1578 stop:2543 length:966 start_codon:yes stop_codon:yes gene_type:complete
MSDQYVPALRQRFLEDMQIKGLQPKTQTMYLRGMRDFTRFLGHAPDSATPEELRAFQLDMKERGVGAPTFNNRLTVLSFFFAATCPRPEMKRHMRYQRAAKKIPVVLSAEEVTRIIEAAPGPGLRYRAAFSVAYGGGLRASEVTHLKVGDIDSDRMLIRIEQGKGRKDRQVMLSPSLLDLLRDYYREARPRGWMFSGRNRVDPISTRQFNRAFKVACDFAEIKKTVSPHTLRHSFATHLLENGTDIRVIQVLLGHAKLETTTVYTKVATKTIQSVTSPLDLLQRPEAGSGQTRPSCRVPNWRSRTSSAPMALHIAGNMRDI